MSLDEKLVLIENVLSLEANSLTEETLLADLPEWDSLNILNLLIEITLTNPNLTFDDLYGSVTVGDVCGKIP